jgi:hypothetical protein
VAGDLTQAKVCVVFSIDIPVIIKRCRAFGEINEDVIISVGPTIGMLDCKNCGGVLATTGKGRRIENTKVRLKFCLSPVERTCRVR